MLGKFVTEALGEQLLIRALGTAWNLIKGIFTEEVTKKTKEKFSEFVNSKGWEDEHFFELDLAESGISAEKRRIIGEGVKLAEDYDKANNTQSARHFRIIVSFGDKKEVKGRAERPGIIIIRKLADSCSRAEDVFFAIQVMGAMHDPKFSFEQLMHMGKTVMLPFLIQKAAKTSKTVSAEMRKSAIELEKKAESGKSHWLKKLFIN